MHRHLSHKFLFPNRLERGGFTLVEIMVALTVFAVAVVSLLGAFTFALKSVDQARTKAQVTQILLNEMESMRMRTWANRTIGDGANAQILLGTSSLGTTASFGGTPTMDSNVSRTAVTYASLPEDVKRDIRDFVEGESLTGTPTAVVESPFYPFAIYGVRSQPTSAPPYPVARVGDEILGTAKVQLRPGQNGYTCRRYAYNFSDASTGSAATMIILRVSWTDQSGSHAKTSSTIIQANGLNNRIIRTGF